MKSELTPLMSSLSGLMYEKMLLECQNKPLYQRSSLTIIPDPDRHRVPYQEIQVLLNKHHSQDREAHIRVESIAHPDTHMIAITTPKLLRRNIWKNQLFRYEGVNLGFSILSENGANRVVPQKTTDRSTIIEFFHALRSAYPDGLSEDQALARANHITESENRRSELTQKLLEKNLELFPKTIADSVTIPDRLMTEQEMTTFLSTIHLLSHGYHQAHGEIIHYDHYVGYGECLTRSMISMYPQGNSDESMPDIVVPIKINAGDMILYTTATIMFLNGFIEAIHVNHGNRILIQALRALHGW